MTSPRLSLKKRLLFSIILISIPVLFVEALVRTYFAIQIGPRVLLYGTPFSRHQEKFDPKGVVARQLKEESTVAFHDNVTGEYSKYYPHQKLVDRDEFGDTIKVTINSRGFRGKDFTRGKPPGVIRIVTLGASSTFGFKDHDQQTYPFQLEQMLNNALPRLNAGQNSSSNKPITAFEVINLGVPHLRTHQIYALLVNEGLALDPDFVTFYEGINDAAWEDSPDTSTERTKQAIKAVPFANDVFREMRYRSLAVALIGMLMTQNINAERTESDVQALRQGKREHFIANLQRMHEACRRNNCKLIVANQQAKSIEDRPRESMQGMRYQDEQAMVRNKLSTQHRVTPTEAFFLVHKELMDAGHEWAGANGVPYADVISAMDSNRQYLVTWVHLNVAGNRIVASALADTILEQIAGKRRLATDKP